jgi:diguanylate cyclase
MPNNRAPMPAESVPAVRRTPAIRRTLAAACTAAAAGVLLYLLDATAGLPGDDRLYDAWVYCGVLMLSGAVIGLRAVIVAAERAAWAALAVCHVLQVAGWVVYWPLAEAGPNPPHPPAADALWVLSYFLALGALLLLVRARATRFDRALLTDAALGVLALAALSSAIVIPRILGTTGDNGAVLVGLTYPLADLVIAGIVITVFALNGWRPAASWALIGAALSIQVVADPIHLFQTAGGNWQPGMPLGAVLLVASMLAAAAA